MSHRPDLVERPRSRGRRDADVAIIGGGPAGSALGWDLATRGVRVLLIDRARFPREKVCGDYVGPRGLQILERMGCLRRIEQSRPLPITQVGTFVNWECHYLGEIPYYRRPDGRLSHGYVIPRDELDTVLLETAERAGAIVHQETRAARVNASASCVVIEARRLGKPARYRSRLVVGADGVNSIVRASTGTRAHDPRYTAVAQRAYATGVSGDLGEGSLFFDADLFPGYGWMFPIAGGRANIGVGILSETRRRLDVNVPALFSRFVERLRRFHPRCEHLELLAPAIGGSVRTYGGVSRNYFPGGVLIGDAGSFADPMTGEGITPALESALLAAPVLQAALEAGRFDARALSGYESAFHSYFDPAMGLVALYAAMLRNRQLAGPWLKALARGCELARTDHRFAESSGRFFGGPDIEPLSVVVQMWTRIARDLVLAGPRSLRTATPNHRSHATSVADLLAWQTALSRSLFVDPVWHSRWAADVQRSWLRLLPGLWRRTSDPRAALVSARDGPGRGFR